MKHKVLDKNVVTHKTIPWSHTFIKTCTFNLNRLNVKNIFTSINKTMNN